MAPSTETFKTSLDTAWFDDSFALTQVERVDYAEIKPASGVVAKPEVGTGGPWI